MAHKPWVLGVKSVGLDFSVGRECLPKERQVEDLNPEEMVMRGSSPWVIKGTATASGDLHPW